MINCLFFLYHCISTNVELIVYNLWAGPVFYQLILLFRTPLGRARAWLRLALMQKKMADYLRCLIIQRDLLRLVPLNHVYFHFLNFICILSSKKDEEVLQKVSWNIIKMSWNKRRSKKSWWGHNMDQELA